MPYSREARNHHGDRIEPFVLGEDKYTLWIHFLYPVMWRKEVIERKVARKKAGRKLGNQYYHPPGELSEAEVRRRLGWILSRSDLVGLPCDWPIRIPQSLANNIPHPGLAETFLLGNSLEKPWVGG